MFASRCLLHRSEGGFFNAIMSFPQDYPNSPPTVRFTSEMWHPNGESESPDLRHLQRRFRHRTRETVSPFRVCRMLFAAQTLSLLIALDVCRPWTADIALRSVPGRQSVHQHPALAWQRPQQLRGRLRALVARPDGADTHRLAAAAKESLARSGFAPCSLHSVGPDLPSPGGDHPRLDHLHALRAERRVAGEHRRRGAPARADGGRQLDLVCRFHLRVRRWSSVVWLTTL